MDFFKTWIVPPLVGAIIGYFTNWLAIKMLFRPLKPVYLGKIRLPFTPGILPRERIRLTESVGDTVSRELLTADVFRSRLVEPALKLKIEQSIYIVVDDFLGNGASNVLKSFASVEGNIAGNGAAGNETGAVSGSGFPVSEAGGLVAASLDAVLRSGEFRQALSDAASHAVAAAGKIPVERLLPTHRLGEMAERFAETWGDGDKQAMVGAFVDRIFDPSPNAGPLVSPKAFSPLLDVATRSLYSSLLPIVEKILASESMRVELNVLAMDMVRRAIGRLGPIQRLIVGAANYEKTLADTMPETIDDVTGSLMRLLKDPHTAARIVESVLRYTQTARLPHSSAPIVGIFPVPELKNAIKAFFLELRDEKSSFAENIERRYLSIAGKPLGELLPGLPETLADSIKGSLSTERVPDGLKPEPVAGLLSGALSVFILSYANRIEGKGIGEILGLGENEKKKIASFVADGITQALSSQAERLVEALDIQSMVVDKLNDLDMADIERIILQVVNDELTWITVLGGVLGGLIGIVQSLLSLL